MHENSLANLKPPWQPGESGSPGRKTAGAYISEWINQLSGRTREQVEAVFADESAEMAKRIAAARLLRAMRLDAEGDRATELVCDRTAGRPVQAVVTVTADVADLGAMLVEVQRLAGLPVVDAPQLPTSVEEPSNGEPTDVEAEAVPDEDGQEGQ